MRHSRWRGVDWEARLWAAAEKIATAMAANPRGVVPGEDAKVAVAFASRLASEYIEAVDGPEPTTEEVAGMLKQWTTSTQSATSQ